jgi:hypothetical protein
MTAVSIITPHENGIFFLSYSSKIFFRYLNTGYDMRFPNCLYSPQQQAEKITRARSKLRIKLRTLLLSGPATIRHSFPALRHYAPGIWP